jgi:hypothetical protein
VKNPEYIESLKQQVDKDTKLFAYFKQIKDANKVRIVEERIAIVKAELAEMA